MSEETMEQEKFFVMPDHILLLKRMYVGWNNCEFGAPSIDCKRPYGNSDVVDDILRILQMGEKEASVNYAKRLHKEMQTVLQILVCNPTIGITAGIYSTPKYRNKWTKEAS